MKKGGLGRTLYYFTCKAQLYMAGILAGSFVMAIYQWFLISDDALDFSDILDRTTVMLAFITFLVLFTAGMEFVQKWLAVLVSFGCSRKNVFLGGIAMHLQIILESLVLFEVLMWFSGWEKGTLLLSLAAALYLVSQGISQLMGAAAQKWGRTAGLVLAIVFFIFGVTMANLLLAGRPPGALLQWVQEIVKPVWQCFLVAAAGTFCVVANLVSYRIISGYEVKL